MIPRSHYRLPKSVYVRALRDLAFIKTLWYSARFRRPVLIGRRSRLLVPRGAELRIVTGGVLALGLAPAGSTGASVELAPRSTLTISGFVQVLRGARVALNWDANLSIGSATYINEGALIDCGERMTIGERCAIGRQVAIMDTDSHHLVRDGREAPVTAPVNVEDGCWLGHGAIVLKGVRLGEGCVIGAGAVVTRSAEPGQLLLGAPAWSRGSVTWRR